MLTGLLKDLVLESPEIETLGLDSPQKIGFCLHFGQLQVGHKPCNLKLSLNYYL